MPRDPSDPFPPGLSQPARRALHGAGILTMRDVERFGRAELMQLHGFGPAALETLEDEMRSQGTRLRD